MASRSHRNLKIGLPGMLTVDVAADAVRRTARGTATKMTSVCPACTDPTGVKQQYVCETGQHGPFTAGELHKARPVDGALVKVDAATVKAAKAADVTDPVVDITPHPADQVLTATRPGAKGYRLRPQADATSRDVKLYQALLVAASTPGFIWVGRANLHGTPELFRLEVWQDQVMLCELVHPDDITDPVTLGPVELSDRDRAMAAQLAEAMAEDFDPVRYRSDAAERLDAAARAVASGEVPAPVATTAGADALDGDVLSMLESVIAPKVTPRTPRKTGPAKRAAKKGTPAGTTSRRRAS